MRRIGVLLNLAQDDPETAIRQDAFVKTLDELGWREGPNLKIYYRWSVADLDRIQANVAELLATKPDVILVHGAVI